MSAYNVLITKKIAPALVKLAKEEGVELKEIEFIEIVECDEATRVNEIGKEQASVIFTSRNSVNIVSGFLDGKKPDWKIFCIEGSTRQQAANYFGENSIAGTGLNAGSLAKAVVAKDNEKEVIFFCGDRRRDELPDELKENDIRVEEVVVYETRLSPEEIGQHFDGIAFFSPSAVESFFSANVIDDQTIFFSIGDATTTALKKFAKNKVITCAIPSEEVMVKTILSYIKQANG